MIYYIKLIQVFLGGYFMSYVSSGKKTMNPFFNMVSKVGKSTNSKTVTKLGVCAKVFYFLILNIIGILAEFYLVPNNISFMVSIASFILMFVMLLICVKSPSSTPISGSIYSLLQGLAIGWAVTTYASLYDGIIIIALGVTGVVVLSMLMLYACGVITVGHKFRTAISSMFLTIILISLITFISSFFTPVISNTLYGDGIIGTVYALVCTLIITLHLAIDFDNIAKAVEMRSDKMYEWPLAMGLATTIVMLFLRILELISRAKN